jgi:phosphoserine aminotransferase
MISFYPGPSRIYDEIPKYVADAARLGIMSMNHRSEEFIALSKKTITLLKQKLNIPKDYTIFFTSSATECWEIIAQSWVTATSYHIYNGAFGEKWYTYTQRLRDGAQALPFNHEKKIKPEAFVFNSKQSVICITQNETSNGTQVSNAIIKKIKTNNPESLVAVDATSSMAGIVLDFKAADIWFASVQKCFGLPAGMALMVCSPNAIQKANLLNQNLHYNSVVFMNAMMEKWQTPYTPNVLNIYLLMRVLEKSKPIREVHKRIVNQYKKWITLLDKHKYLQHLIKNKAVHSYTVLPVETIFGEVNLIKIKAKQKGYLLGEGYGTLKANTFRIANFPAIKATEIKLLQNFLNAIR